MKKLLLGLIASLALISTTLYAACTADVDMGNNKITNLAAGTADGDAVNYEQVLKRTDVDVAEANASLLTSASASYNVRVEKVGSMCVLHGMVKNVSGGGLGGTQTFGNLPAGYRPYVTTRFTAVEDQGDTGYKGFISNSTGEIRFYTNMGATMPTDTQIPLSVPFACR